MHLCLLCVLFKKSFCVSNNEVLTDKKATKLKANLTNKTTVLSKKAVFYQHTKLITCSGKLGKPEASL